MNERRLSKRRYSPSEKVICFSDRSGMPYPYAEMVYEPGTNLLVHKSESDGAWNRMDVLDDPVVPADAQRLEHPRPSPTQLEAISVFLTDADTEEGLFIDNLQQNQLIFGEDFF
jgi:hypothetical protein